MTAERGAKAQSDIYSKSSVDLALRDAFLQTAEQAAQVLKTVAFTVVQVAGALKDAFLQSAQDAAAILKAILFSPLDVGTALRDAFFRSAEQAAAIMKAVLFAAGLALSGMRPVRTPPS